MTVGGGFSGTSGESSSFRHSFFDRTISWIETALANGETVTASNNNSSDLSFGAASSFGTLGNTTLLRRELIEAKKHIEVTYNLVASITEAITETRNSVGDLSIDYVNSILYFQTSGVICSGRRCARSDTKIRQSHRSVFLHSYNAYFEEIKHRIND